MEHLLQNGSHDRKASRALTTQVKRTGKCRDAAFVRRSRPMLQWAFLVLGIMVFMWGTRYKLSLYSAAHPGRMPAKLCMRSSDSGKIAAQIVVPSPAPRPLLLAAAWPSGDAHIPTAIRWTALERSSSLLPSARSSIPQYSLRPPPVSARLLV